MLLSIIGADRNRNPIYHQADTILSFDLTVLTHYR